jgi:superfamily II DNA or RNA helicase
MASTPRRSSVSAPARPSPKKRAKKKGQPRLSRMRKPEDMSLEAWQRELRRQFGPEQPMKLTNLGDAPVFSEFEVYNPQSKGQYRVRIRGERSGENHCTCPDFRTNNLGTCKHIEFALDRLRRKRGGKKALAEGYQPPFSEVYLHYGAEREVRFRPGSECSRKLAQLAAAYFDADGRLAEDAFRRFDRFVAEANEADHELRIYEDALEFIAEVRDAARRQEILAEALPAGVRSKELDRLIKLPLYKYQKEGVLFAARAGRSLLGDEMGLGKTIQAIAASELMARCLGVERVLVVCPTSLKHQWEQEIARATGRTALVTGGLQHQRRAVYEQDSLFKITNYDVVHRDLEIINRWSPDLVILDEAQRIKNWETRAARSVKQIRSPYCLVLTGTPLENRLEELVSIVQFIDKHRLGPTYRFLHEHQVREEETGRVIGYKDLDRVSQTLAPVLLRRRKKEVLTQLPERLEKNFFLPMTEPQWGYHAENQEIVSRVVSKWRKYGFLTEADQRRLMIALQNMRMSCDSTYLLDQKTDHSTKPDELAQLLEEAFEESDAKVVIFSQWVRMHELVQRRLTPRGWDHVFFHGGVEGRKRKGLVGRFKEDPKCRAFLSTDAGGVGLNLQHANVVINLDLPWNPAVLEQRIGRVHRLGQTQPVRVVNYVSEGTIEQGMLSLLGFKKSLFSGVLDDGEKEVFLGKSRLNRFMETVEKATTSMPAERPAAEEPEEREPAPPAAATNGHAKRNGKAPDNASAPQDQSTTVAPAQATDPLSGLLQHGVALLEQLARASQPPRSGEATERSAGAVQVVHDERNEPYLKIPMPKPEAVAQALAALQTLMQSLRA